MMNDRKYPAFSKGDVISIKESYDNGWWECKINGVKAYIHIDKLVNEDIFNNSTDELRKDNFENKRKKNMNRQSSGKDADYEKKKMILSEISNVDQNSSQFDYVFSDDEYTDPKKKNYVVTKASKLMKGIKDAVTKSDSSHKYQISKKKKEEIRKEFIKKNLSEPKSLNPLELAYNSLKDITSDIDDIKTEMHLIIKALNETTTPFEDSRFPSIYSPEQKILDKMLENPYSVLFSKNGTIKSINVASSYPMIYKEILVPPINLGSISEQELQSLMTLDFDIFPYKERDDYIHTFLLIMAMFYKFDLPQIFKIKDITLYRFIYAISRRYRHVPFHNFYHAFNVTQTMYYFLTTCQAAKLFGPLEILALLVAALCHDCDHPGLNNEFQRKAQTRVYHMHKKSVLENHHYLQCMSVLAMPETNIFANLTQEQESLIYIYLRDLILATDLAVQGVILNTLKERVKVLHKHFKNETPSQMQQEDRKVLMCSLIKSSDLSNEIRKQSMSSKWAKLVFEEFVSQAEKEKEMNLPVTPFMDRDKIIVAKEQMNFIEKLCLPLYEQMANIFPEMTKCYNRLEENRNIWQRRLLVFCQDRGTTDIKKIGSNKSLWENKQVKDKGDLSSTLAMRATSSPVILKRQRAKHPPPPILKNIN